MSGDGSPSVMCTFLEIADHEALSSSALSSVGRARRDSCFKHGNCKEKGGKGDSGSEAHWTGFT